uniref:Uncharacterized protein n=1 Tax=Strix occidentalis caurina TaxID=311401 RepID=A0A8D0KX73_STROC
MVCTLCLVSVFKEKPPHPPSRAQALIQSRPTEEYSYMQSILRLLRNANFLLLMVTYGLNTGCFYALSTLLNRMVIRHYPVSASNPLEGKCHTTALLPASQLMPEPARSALVHLVLYSTPCKIWQTLAKTAPLHP